MLMAGMSLGTAWAIRGQFGHEHGAAWAGAIGSLSILVLPNAPIGTPKPLPLPSREPSVGDWAAWRATALWWDTGAVLSL